MRLIDRLLKRDRAPAPADGSEILPDRQLAAQCRALADAGQYHQAIELLNEENRRSRRREIDKLLLSLRSEGFLAGAWQKDVPEWPDPISDTLPGEGIPEIPVEALDASSIRSGIEHHGSLIVRQLITPAQVDVLRDDIDRVADAFDAIESGNANEEDHAWHTPFDRDDITDRAKKRAKGAMLTADSPPALFDLLEIFESCGLSAAIREFFCEPPALLTRKGTLRRVRPDVTNGGWHQDGGFLGENIRSLNIWLALTDCGIDAPGMDIVARRLPGIVQTGSNFAKWATNPQAAREVGEGHTVRPVFAAGDAIIFDHLCLHRTASDPGMTKTRYAIETWLMAPSTYGHQGGPILF